MGAIILLVLAVSIVALFVWSAAQPPPETMLSLERKARKEQAEANPKVEEEPSEVSDENEK